MPAITLEALFDSLPQAPPVPDYNYVTAAEMPEPFRQLLAHNRHMTIAMETYHRCKIGVQVLQSTKIAKNQWYARQIVLHPLESNQIVQGGIVRIHLSMLDPAVQVAILREDTPLGHVLINHDVLRHIEVKEYVRIEPGPALSKWPGFAGNEPAYGRLGILYCDLQPAIELFEVIPAASLK